MTFLSPAAFNIKIDIILALNWIRIKPPTYYTCSGESGAMASFPARLYYCLHVALIKKGSASKEAYVCALITDSVLVEGGMRAAIEVRRAGLLNK